MTHSTHLHFATQTSVKKPETITNEENSCPFCEVDLLQDIIAKEGSIILLKNKFSTLHHTFQTVLIETDDCHSELSSYKKEHLYKVIRFAITNWLEFEKKKEYKSVILFKNHGPLSGGTIRHPHMQIVGLENVDYRQNISSDYFEGVTIHKNEGVEFNLANKPKMGFYEINVLLYDLKFIDEMADCIQTATNFVLNHFRFKCNSYNLFFYHLDGVVACKIIPRFITTPLYIGYSIPQVPDDVEFVAEKIKDTHRMNQKEKEVELL
jgi:ATP adenylyltransferase/5',5'''-P-1,P-4-tetraphosphate phosphorylase II